jgi:nicotinamide riboside kinase
VEREHAALAAARRAGQPWVIFDSSPLVTAAYSAFYFADPAALAPAAVHQRSYHRTLLCAPDLPWIADGVQRDGVQVRAAFDRHLRAVLHAHHVPFYDVRGAAAARTACALQALEGLAGPGAGSAHPGIE